LSRILLVAAPFAAHLAPLVAIGRELAARGHAVAWVTHGSLRDMLPPGAQFYDTPGDEDARAITERGRLRPPRFGAAEVAWFYDEIVRPLARTMVAGVDAAVRDFVPDAVVADQHALAGAYAARRHGLPWATSAATAIAQLDAADEHPALRRWLAAWHAQEEQAAGLPASVHPDLSPSLVLLYTSRLLAGAASYPPGFQFVGPPLAQRIERDDFPWPALEPRPRVLVSLGSIVAASAHRFFAALCVALRDEDVQVLVSAPPGVLAAAPANFLVRPWLPQLALFPHVQAVVTHGGSTALDALAHDLPQVVAPVWTDNFITARKLADAGAAVRVRFGRATARDLRDAVRAVRDEPRFRDAARTAGASLRAAGGTAAAAGFVARLAAGGGAR
jgi:MGT family glycosyltransferase